MLRWGKSKDEIYKELLVAQQESQERIFKDFCAALEGQSRVLQTWMDSFKVTEVPRSTVFKDEDILAKERAYYKELGFPINEPIDKQVAFMLKDIGE